MFSSATLKYSATATNATAAALNAAMAAVPLYSSAANDPVLKTMFQATVTSDTTATVGQVVSRTIVLAIGAAFAKQFPGTNGSGAFNGLFTSALAQALATPITETAPAFA